MKWFQKLIVLIKDDVVSNDLDSKEKENLYDQRINEELEETPKKILNPKI